jgi:glycosyltransferase involved in cell wall biosynthesis
MRILFISSIQMWGGAEVWLMDVVRGLGARGHAVTIACRPGTILEKNARAQGFDVVPVAMRSDFDPLVVQKVARILRERKIEIVSTNMDKELRFGGLAARLVRNVAVVPSREVDYPLKNKLRYRFTYNVLADRVIANSVATKRSLLINAPWLKPDRIEVVYKGIDPARYLERPEEGDALRRELGIPADAPLVGFVGQVIERKGVHDIAAALPLVLNARASARFLVVGEGKLDGFLRQRLADAGVADRVVFAGFRNDIPAVMKAVDLLILPSIVEGFGYVLVEAMAAAKPVVATNVSSIPEIVQHGETGVLVDVNDPPRLANAIGDLLDDPAKAHAMGERGRSVMLDKFTLERMIDRIESVFARAIDAQSAHRVDGGRSAH